MSISRKSALLTGLQSPISPLSLGVQNSELGLRALRYHRVVIMAGAHVDGARIHLLPLDTRFRFVSGSYFFSIFSVLNFHIRRVGQDFLANATSSFTFQAALLSLLFYLFAALFFWLPLWY